MNSVVRESRDRKKTSFFEASAPQKPRKAIEIVTGSGVKLGDLPKFCKELDRKKSEDDLLKAMHSLLYGTAGKKTEIKKNLRQFSGFDASVDVDAKLAKISEKKAVWTVPVLKDALGMFGLEKGGSRSELIERMVEYIKSPALLKSSAIKEKTAAGKGKKGRKTTTTGTKRKRGVGKDGNPKKKRAPTAYILFSMEFRSKLKEEQPELDFKELAQRTGKAWAELSDEKKQEYMDQSAAKKAELDLEQGVADDFDEEEEAADEEDKEEEEEEEEEEEGEEKKEEGEDKEGEKETEIGGKGEEGEGEGEGEKEEEKENEGEQEEVDIDKELAVGM